MSAVDTCASTLAAGARLCTPAPSVVIPSDEPGARRAGRRLERLVEEPVERVLALDRAAAADAAGSKPHEIEPVAQRGRHASTAIPVRKDTPGAPGPARVEHERADAVRAGHRGRFRITARSIVGPAGAAGSSGTVSVPHWNPSSHACQAMAFVCGSAALPTPAPPPSMRHVTRSSAAGARRPGESHRARMPHAVDRTRSVAPGRPDVDDAQGGRRLRPVVLGRPRRTEEMTLGHLALERPQRRKLLERLDALRDRTEAQRVREVHDRAADGVAVAVTTEVGDERGGDLDRIDRKLLQRYERRRASPEIVDDQPHADLAQLTQRDVARVPVVEQRGLGDLEPHRTRREAGVADDPLHLRGEGRLAELAGREVEVQLERRPVPSCHDAICRHACSIVQLPTGTMRPVTSASGRNSPGSRSPCSGCSHARALRSRPPDRWRS